MSQVVVRGVSSRAAALPAFEAAKRSIASPECVANAPLISGGVKHLRCEHTARRTGVTVPPTLHAAARSSAVNNSAFLGSVNMLRVQERQQPKASQKKGMVSAELPSLAETEAVPVRTPDGALQKFPAAPAVYAVYDSSNELQYLGLSRKVSVSIQAHAEDLPDLVASVKVAVVQNVDRAALQAAWKSWTEQYVQEAGKVPPGNVSGNEMWTKRKTRSAKPEIRLTPGAHVKLTVPLEDIIDKVVKDVPVVAFIKGTRTAPQCGFSHRVLTLLNESRVDYEVVNVLDEEHNPGLRDAIKSYSQWPTIPQVFVKGEFVGGADILEEMVQKDELKPLLKK